MARRRNRLVRLATRTDLNAIPIELPAEKQALTDLLGRTEVEASVTSVAKDELDAARAEVARGMGW
jgi:hypothetical protein